MSHEEDLEYMERQREIEKAESYYALSSGLVAFLGLACVSLVMSIKLGAEHEQGTFVVSIVMHVLTIGGVVAGIAVNEIKGRKIIKPRASHYVGVIFLALITLSAIGFFLV